MRAPLLLLLAICAHAINSNENEERRSKLPFVADAVGNALPPPSSVPATVGSPVNLLTPDRYEFYTFDESGELVKRLMTLEEIQAIVAAGEDADGLVTFANDNQPTIAFNFSQPPYTKVHNVVTNVQNVLKAQMEAHKNKPQIQPTLDTPDVSDSWSLILPSIFGNTGNVDIIPDRIQYTGSFTTPDTETIELTNNAEDDENSIAKEGSNQFINSTLAVNEESKLDSLTEKIPTLAEDPKAEQTTKLSDKPNTTRKPTINTTSKPIAISKSTTTTPATISITTTTSTTTTRKPITTIKPRTTSTSTTTTSKPISTTIITTTTTSKPTKITTSKVIPTVTTVKPKTSTSKIISTTNIPSTSKASTTTSTTHKPRTTTVINKSTAIPELVVKITPKTTTRPTTQKHIEGNLSKIQIQTVPNSITTTEKYSAQYEKVSTFIPVSTAAYITSKTTFKPLKNTEYNIPVSSTTKRSPTTTENNKPLNTTIKTQTSTTTTIPLINNFTYVSSTVESEKEENDKINATTVTTQSVSPSTTVSSTEFIYKDNININLINHPSKVNSDINKPIMPLFDVAQSISQIASDLGGNYRPIPTSSILDATKINGIDLESKESLEMDIPIDPQTDSELKTSNDTENNNDNFVKISTLDPHNKNDNERIIIEEQAQKNNISTMITATTEKVEPTTVFTERTTIDPILSESMGDLLSQIVNQAPQAIINSEKNSNDIKLITTEKYLETTSYATVDNAKTTIAPSLQEELEVTTKTDETTSELPNINNKLSENTDGKEKDQNKKVKLNVTISGSSNTQNEDKTQNGIQITETQVNNNATVASSFNVVTENSINISSEVEKNHDVYNIVNTVDKQVTVTSTADTRSESTTELLSKLESTTSEYSTITVTESTITSIIPFKNKFESNDNKLNNKDKIQGSLPKIDEFKKKIQKVNIDDKELTAERNNSWKLISTVSPPKSNEIPKDKFKNEGHYSSNSHKDIVLDFSKENQGLEVTTKDLGEDISQFTELCNELAFRYWNAIVENIDKRRSFVLSPYSITSMLAMMFMGARGATSGEMNEILKLDDMVTFNPHFTLKNISDSIETSPEAGVIVSAFIRELYSDRNKGKILTFYKERAQHFYNGHVEEVNFKLIGDIIRRRTNLLVKRYTWGKIPEYMKANTVNMEPPLAAFSANIFQTDCSGSSVEGRDGEMYFVVSPNVRQRRLVPVPAVVYKSGFLAGYDPVLDATAAALGNTNSVISTLFVMPGQQGNVVHSEDLEGLEQRLLESNPSTPAWNRLLRTLLPRIGLELQIPRFSHKSIFNVSSTLRKMGLKDLFDAEHADLGGLNGPSKDLYLSDMIQTTTFVTCGEGVIGDQHHMEEYPEILTVMARHRTSRWVNDWDEPRDYQRAFHDPHDVGEAMHLPLHLRPRQARLPARNAQPARLKFDRPFLYFVRHNPSGMILYVGRYNPRLLP
ncbi:uncharacterized protein ACR2FA_000879 [Aphomia sociella]